MAAEAARAVARRRAMMVGRGEAICWGAAFGGLGKQNFLCRINLEPKRTADGGVGSWEPKLPEPKAKKKNWEERHPCMGMDTNYYYAMQCDYSYSVHILY